MQNDIRYKHNGFIPEHYILEVNRIDLPEQYIINTGQIEYKIKVEPISKKEFKKLEMESIVEEWAELQQDIDSEFVDIVNDNFFDLI